MAANLPLLARQASDPVLAHFMYQINEEMPPPNGWKTPKPCKIVYVGKKVVPDSRHIKEFRSRHTEKHSEEQKTIQDELGMPSLHSPDIPPNHETGNTYKPYVYIDGEVSVSGSDLTVDIVDSKTHQKSTYENGKVIAPFKGDFVCKIVRDGYVSNDIVIGKEYVESGIFYTSTQKDDKGRTLITGKVSESMMNSICESMFGLCESLRGIFDKATMPGQTETPQRKKTTWKMGFRILVLPVSVKNSKISYQTANRAPIGVDSFKNDYSEIPSSVHKSATYATVDDMAYMLNPTEATKTPGELVRYWGSHPVIGNQTFEKIGMNLDRDFYSLSGFKWYFGSPDTKFARERHAKDDGTEEIGPHRDQFKHGIWHQLYEGMGQAGSAAGSGSGMVVICAKKLNIARIEIVLSESVTVASLQKSLLVNGVSLAKSEFEVSDTYRAMEEALLSADKNPDWSMYMEGVMEILGGRKMDRERLVRHITANFRERYAKDKWKLKKNWKKAARFLVQARFVVAALASPTSGDGKTGYAEEYAYRMGKLVGTYARFADVKNIAELGLQPGATCDARLLRRNFHDITKKLSLSKKGGDLNSMILGVKRHMPSKELAPKDTGRDLTLNFYMGIFREL